MEPKHTSEPWHTSVNYYRETLLNGPRSQEGVSLCIAVMNGAGEQGAVNGQRIAACVNACAGFSNDDLLQEKGSFQVLARRCWQLEQEKAELLEALDNLVREISPKDYPKHSGMTLIYLEAASNIIAKAKAKGEA